MRIGLIGAGVLGSLFAGRLSSAGHDVTLIARGRRLRDLESGPLTLTNEADGLSTRVLVAAAPALLPNDNYELVIVMVRANQLESLLPSLSANTGVPCFLFMNNRASGSGELVRALGAQRIVLGFPGAGGEREGNMIHYRLIAEQPTTIGELDGRLSARVQLLASTLRQAGFRVALTRHMDDWLKVHAVFVTAIAGAIYNAGGQARMVASSDNHIRDLVIAIPEGFAVLSKAGVSIEPKKLALLFSLPRWIPQLYWRRYLSAGDAELIFARHARAAPDEMWALVGELRAAYPGAFDVCLELTGLWACIQAAAAEAGRLPGA